MRIAGVALLLSLMAVTACSGGSTESCSATCENQCGDVDGCDCGTCAEGSSCVENQCVAECSPSCQDLECGDDGCGGVCGECLEDEECQSGLCQLVCVGNCEGKLCGDDGCGGSCGTCLEGLSCFEGACTDCVPECEGLECGDDGCGGTCGDCPEARPWCRLGVCDPECTPQCEGRDCGDDGCDGSCGTCGDGLTCDENGLCRCSPQCEGLECGDDGCGGSCGTCTGERDLCEGGLCVCYPDCVEKLCGDNGCGGTCGECPLYHTCTGDGTCVCLPDCDDRECGSDGCGGLCGGCGCGEQCVSYQCDFQACDNRECGADGCGGSCGSCGSGKACVAGLCPDPAVQCDDDNEVDWDGCTGGMVTEFLVNQQTLVDQSTPFVLARPQGDYYVFWQDSAGDLQSWGIRMRHFPADGSTAGAPVTVNSWEYNGQTNVAAAALTGGGFVVVWQSTAQDGGMEGVFGRRFTASGVATGTEFQVNTFTNYSQAAPTVAGLAGGGFVVMWESSGQDGSEEGVYAQVFDAAGNQLGVEHRVNTHTVARQRAPQVRSLSDGSYLSAWGSFGQDGDGWGVFAQRFDASDAPLGTEFQVNTTTYSYQDHPVIAPLANSGFVVLWSSVLQDGSEEGIVGQRFSSVGTAGAEFLVNVTTQGSQASPSVVALPDGGFAAAWTSAAQDGDGKGVVLRKFSATAVPTGGEVVVNQFSAGDQSAPRLDVFPDGTLVLVWQSVLQDGSGLGIYARRLSSSSALIYR